MVASRRLACWLSHACVVDPIIGWYRPGQLILSIETRLLEMVIIGCIYLITCTLIIYAFKTTVFKGIYNKSLEFLDPVLTKLKLIL